MDSPNNVSTVGKRKMTAEQRQKRLEYTREWRKRNATHLKEYDRLSAYRKMLQKRAKTFKDKRCLMCEIPLVMLGVGAKRTVKYCYGCSLDKNAKERLRYAMNKQKSQ